VHKKRTKSTEAHSKNRNPEIFLATSPCWHEGNEALYCVLILIRYYSY